jgi:hypothetical protein
MNRSWKFGMIVTCTTLLLASSLLRSAYAEHFDILLQVKSGDKQAEASMDTTPPIGGVNPRPVLKVHVGDPIQVAWRLKNSSPHGALKGVTIHFFVVRQAKTGQKPVPDPAGQAGLFDSSFTTDLAIAAVSTGSLKLKIGDPGNYLVRLQSEGTHEEAGHEHFSAVDVEVR